MDRSPLEKVHEGLLNSIFATKSTSTSIKICLKMLNVGDFMDTCAADLHFGNQKIIFTSLHLKSTFCIKFAQTWIYPLVLSSNILYFLCSNKSVFFNLIFFTFLQSPKKRFFQTFKNALKLKKKSAPPSRREYICSKVNKSASQFGAKLSEKNGNIVNYSKKRQGI